MKKENKDATLLAVIAIIITSLLVVPQVAKPASPNIDEIVAKQEASKYSDFFYEYELNRYPSAAEVVELKAEKTLIGFNIDSDKINFGVVPGNGSFSKKTVNLTNLIGKEKLVIVKSLGEIAPYVTFDKNNFVLKNGEKTQIEILFRTENNGLAAGVGNYTGEIDITIATPKFDFVYLLWDFDAN